MAVRGILVLLLILAVVPTAVADVQVRSADPPVGETATIAEGDALAYRIYLEADQTVHLSVTVVQGTAIDVYFTTADGFREYTDTNATSFYTFNEPSRETTTAFATDFAPPDRGDHYLILDNRAATNATLPTGPVTVVVSLARVPLASPLPLAVGAAAGAAVAALLAVIPLKRYHGLPLDPQRRAPPGGAGQR